MEYKLCNIMSRNMTTYTIGFKVIVNAIKMTKKCPRKSSHGLTKWEVNKVYQHRWVAKFCWFELVHGKNEKMIVV